MKTEKGALVSKVIPGGPAAKAGLETGDVIVTFDGTEIGGWNELPRVVAATPVDKDVEIVVLRDGVRREITAQVGALEETSVTKVADTSKGGPSLFGLRVQDLTPDLADQLGVDEEDGVVVTAVEPGSAADDAGVRRGDVILEDDRSEVKNVGELKKQLAESEKRTLLLVRRGDATLFVPLKRASG